MIRRQKTGESKDRWDELEKLNTEGLTINAVIGSLRKQIFIYTFIAIMCIVFWIVKKSYNGFVTAVLLILIGGSILFVYLMLKKYSFKTSELSIIRKKLLIEEREILKPGIYWFNTTKVNDYFYNSKRLLDLKEFEKSREELRKMSQ